jgi:xanthine dehydrogenase accessory factor
VSDPRAPLRLLAAQGAGVPAAVVLVVSDSARAETTGRRLLLAGDAVTGGLGERELDERALALAREALERDLPEGVHDLVDDEERTVRVYLELHAPPAELVIVGAGHIAQPLCAIGALLGFRVHVLDDRPDFAVRERFPEAERVHRVDFADPFATLPLDRRSHLVLVTRGHKYDYECLRHALAMDPEPAYIGMIGSRRRVRATFVQLIREGFPRERVARVRAPVGLDLKAQTPAEIAVSVAAEIILLRKGGSGRPLRDLERVVERFIPDES